MKRIFIMMAMAIVMGAVLPTTANAADKKEKKEKKAWKWEMPKKMSGDADLDLYLRTCDTLNTRVTSYLDSVTFYSVKVVNVKNDDGTIVQRRCVVDEDGHIRGSNEALAQYIAMTNSGLGLLNDLLKITAQTTSATAAIAGNPLLALSYGKYLKAGPKIAIEGGKTMKELMKRMNEQKKAIRKYKKDYTEAGELRDPTTDASAIDASYPDSEPITKTSAEFDKELADAMEKDKSITIPDGDVDFEG